MKYVFRSELYISRSHYTAYRYQRYLIIANVVQNNIIYIYAAYYILYSFLNVTLYLFVEIMPKRCYLIWNPEYWETTRKNLFTYSFLQIFYTFFQLVLNNLQNISSLSSIRHRENIGASKKVLKGFADCSKVIPIAIALFIVISAWNMVISNQLAVGWSENGHGDPFFSLPTDRGPYGRLLQQVSGTCLRRKMI